MALLQSNNHTSTSLDALLEGVKLRDDVLEVVKEFCHTLDNKSAKDPISLYYLKRQCLPEVIRKKSLQLALERETTAIPLMFDIQDFKFTLETSAVVEVDADCQKKITNEHFLEILNNAPSSIQNCFRSTPLFKESVSYLDEKGRLPTDVIIQFLLLRCNLLGFRVKLAKYDVDGTGALNRQQMTDFLNNEVFTTVRALMDMDESFRTYYRKTVISMFFFFLDCKNFGRCRISDIVISGFPENIFIHQDGEDGTHYENWFSPEKTQELYSTFQMFDENKEGYIRKEVFAKIADGAYTPAFINRLFEVHVNKKGTQMSYDEFIIFQIAQEHLAHPAAMKYFFKVLDLNEDGYLTTFELNYFYKELKSAYCNYLADSEAMPNFSDFLDSMFDMVNPFDPERITIMDLVRCKKGHEFILNLINHVEFYRFEHKESDNGSEDMDNNLDSIMPDVNQLDLGSDENVENIFNCANSSNKLEDVSRTAVLGVLNSDGLPLQTREI